MAAGPCETCIVKRMTVLATALAVALGGYVVADAYDITPGFLTTRPTESEALPYPSVSSASAPEALPSWNADAKVDNAAVTSALGSLAASPEAHGHVSAVVADVATGKTIAQLEPDAARAPASNMKIVTAAVALRVLGPETTLKTTAKIEGKTLYLVGGGDALLGAGGANPAAVNGRAGIGELADKAADAARKAGVTEVAVDSSLFSGPQRNPSVTGGNASFVMELRPLAVNQSRNSGKAYTANPDIQAGQAFAKELAARGVPVSGSVRRSQAPKQAREAASVESAPVRDLVDFMLKHSDNTTAEILGHLVAVKSGEPASFEGAGRATLADLKKTGVKASGVVIDDNSGLSPKNRLSASLLNEIVKKVASCDGCALESITSGFPVSALDGTLDDRMRGSAAAGKVRAKTGTLSNAASLSGFLETKSGRLLTFSILIDGIPDGSFTSARHAIDSFVVSLAGA